MFVQLLSNICPFWRLSKEFPCRRHGGWFPQYQLPKAKEKSYTPAVLPKFSPALLALLRVTAVTIASSTLRSWLTPALWIVSPGQLLLCRLLRGVTSPSFLTELQPTTSLETWFANSPSSWRILATHQDTPCSRSPNLLQLPKNSPDISSLLTSHTSPWPSRDPSSSRASASILLALNVSSEAPIIMF